MNSRGTVLKPVGVLLCPFCLRDLIRDVDDRDEGANMHHVMCHQTLFGPQPIKTLVAIKDTGR